jgi:DNA-binding protein HU-beta
MTRLTDHNTSGVKSGQSHLASENAGSHGSLQRDKPDAFGRQANKGILADRVAHELNIPRRTAARVLDAVLDSVRDLLRGRGKVAVKGFGTFERRIRKGRAYKHPLSGKSIEVADKETILFKPSDQLIKDTRTGAVPPARKPLKSSEDILFRG